jgi:hypothetical protein
MIDFWDIARSWTIDFYSPFNGFPLTMLSTFCNYNLAYSQETGFLRICDLILGLYGQTIRTPLDQGV